MAGILSGIVLVPTTMSFRTNKMGWLLMMLLRVLALVILGVSFYLVLQKFYSGQNLIKVILMPTIFFVSQFSN